jgi:Holliday junction DNA helicase RuvA
MIGSLRGTVLERSTEAEVLLEVQGVGYRVTVTPRTLATLDLGTDAFLHIHHHVREDAQTLYGFTTRDERACFETLLGAHRVGPALALAIIATHPPGELRRVVVEGDVAALTLVPGVGKQTAARLLLELKGRLDAGGLDGLVPAGNGDGKVTATQAVAEALSGLGYSTEEIRDALRELTGGTDPSTLLRDALKVLAVRRA